MQISILTTWSGSLTTKRQMFFDRLFTVLGLVIGGSELLRDFFSEQVFQKLSLLDAGFSGKTTGLDLYLSLFCDIDYDLFHGLFLQLFNWVWMLIGIALRHYRGCVRRDIRKLRCLGGLDLQCHDLV